MYKAIFSHTTRGREQLLFCGQPFIYEKCITLPSGDLKKLWRCNQWWNKKCRARVYTVNDHITPLNKYHTHEDIIKRKKRVSRKIKEDKTDLMLVYGESAQTVKVDFNKFE